MRKLCVLWQDAGAREEGTEGRESAGFNHSRAHEGDVLSAWDERYGSTAGLLVPFKDDSIRVCDTARSVTVWGEILSVLGPLLWGHHPVGQVLAEKYIWNDFGNNLAVVVGPGPADRPNMGGVACLEAVNTAVKWLRGAT
jgi:hypothetical protein